MAAPTPLSPSPPPGGIRTGRILQTTFSVAILVAVLFVGFSPTMFSGNFGSVMALLLTPQPAASTLIPTSERVVRIGIVSGHWGNDSGTVCANGVTEQQVNLSIASLVRQRLVAQGFQVDLLQEFDTRLNGYRAAVLLSIHNDSCDYINEQATGFKVAARGSGDPNLTSRLLSCLTDRYGKITGLPFHAGSITPDMTSYHAFNEVDPSTTAAIIEAGFLYKDYALLTGHPDVVADGIVAGILCFVNNENIAPTPMPTQAP